MEHLLNNKFILASGSPRRKQLLDSLGLKFTVVITDTDESYPENLVREEIPLYLSRKKAEAVPDHLIPDHIVIAADTIVWIDGQVMNKPSDEKEAALMLERLSGKTHEVYTGVTLRDSSKLKSFYSVTSVTFRDLNKSEIAFYISNYQPMDKAGSYGAQDWIGLIAIESITGSYFNVMGLPVDKLYLELKTF
jgi:septum formation protein